MPRVRRRENFHQLTPFQQGRIVGMREAGISFREFGRQIGRPHVIVIRIYRDWQKEDLEGHRTGSGRSRATQERKDRLLKHSVLCRIQQNHPELLDRTGPEHVDVKFV